MKQKLCLLCFDIIFVIYLEFVLSFLLFNHVDLNFLTVILFSIPIGIILYLLTNFFKANINRVINYILLSFLVFFYGAQVVYFKIYNSIISFYSMTEGGQVFQFMDKIIETIIDNALGIVLMILPLVVITILDLKKIISYERSSLKLKGIIFGSFVLIQALAIMTVNLLPSDEIYSTKNLYYNVHAPLLTTKKVGMITTMRLDLQRLIFGFTEKVQIQLEDTEPPVIIEEEKYNMLEIDFETLIANETNTNINTIHEYVSNQAPTKQNDYTGMFEGKNLIVFVAEAFSTLAIRENETPTLYKMYNEGFQFDNFYTPIYPVSTSDGEYITDTALIPKEGVWSMYVGRNNYYPYSYANVFRELGYTNQSYHNHSAGYYYRDQYLLGAMNYDSYRACGMGLNINCGIWPESDLEMINDTVDDYINDEHFVAYYMTVSGHLNYTRTGNMMVSKNWSYVKDLPYSDKAKGYIAANIEFDRALEELLKRLEAANKLEDTVIVISSDHYPYGLTLDEMNELSTYERDDNFNKHHMPLLIWSASMEEPVKIEKYGSSLDVLPTVLNLFGVEYDSRLLIGKDILSDTDPLVIFSNRSWITDKGQYNSINKKFTSFTGEEVDQEYIDLINSQVYNKFQISRLILEQNYYKKLFDNIEVAESEIKE